MERNEVFMDVSVTFTFQVSSRPAMVVSLMDGSTETFWESGEEDRNKSKWVTLTHQQQINNQDPPPPGASRGIHTVSVHIDNCRDLGNKVSSIIFKGSTAKKVRFPNNPAPAVAAASPVPNDDLKVLKQIDVESRWVACCFERCQPQNETTIRN